MGLLKSDVRKPLMYGAMAAVLLLFRAGVALVQAAYFKTTGFQVFCLFMPTELGLYSPSRSRAAVGGWLLKSDVRKPLMYGGIVAVLLIRAGVALRKPPISKQRVSSPSSAY